MPKEQQVREFAASLGRWQAFDMVLAEIDRSSTNFMIDSKGQVVGIDQQVTTGDTQEEEKKKASLIRSSIGTDPTSGQSSLAIGLATEILKWLGDPPGFDAETLGLEVVLPAARDQLQEMGHACGEEEVRRAAKNLGDLCGDAAEAVVRRISAYTAQRSSGL